MIHPEEGIRPPPPGGSVKGQVGGNGGGGTGSVGFPPDP